MRRHAPAAALLGLAALAAPAAAQTDDGEALMRKVHLTIASALNDALEHPRGDRPIPWSDPSGSVTGLITVYVPTPPQGGRLCRSFKYVVHDAAQELTQTGLRCREPSGLWTNSGVPDIVAARAAAPPAPTPLAPAPAAPEAQPDPLLARLQRNLVRLAYADGPADGLRQPGFEAALQQFELDEGLPQGLDPDALRRALAASTAAVARADRGGVCEPPANGQGSALVCGRRR